MEGSDDTGCRNEEDCELCKRAWRGCKERLCVVWYGPRNLLDRQDEKQ
jgi:hypothetical protein